MSNEGTTLVVYCIEETTVNFTNQMWKNPFYQWIRLYCRERIKFDKGKANRKENDKCYNSKYRYKPEYCLEQNLSTQKAYDEQFEWFNKRLGGSDFHKEFKDWFIFHPRSWVTNKKEKKLHEMLEPTNNIKLTDNAKDRQIQVHNRMDLASFAQDFGEALWRTLFYYFSDYNASYDTTMKIHDITFMAMGETGAKVMAYLKSINQTNPKKVYYYNMDVHGLLKILEDFKKRYEELMKKNLGDTVKCPQSTVAPTADPCNNMKIQ